MSLLREIAGEIVGMFVADARLTGAILLLVAAVALLIGLADVDPLIGGLVLLLGCLAILVENVRHAARSR